MKVIMVTLLLAAVALSVAEAGVIGYHAAPAAIVPAPAAVYVAPAPAALVRTPSLDSAVVHSERVGGNFAYSTVEGHAYTALSPAVVHHAPAPVAIAYKAQPVVAPLPAVVHAAAPLPAVYAPAKAFYYAH